MNATSESLIPFVSPTAMGSSTWLLRLRSVAVLGQLLTILVTVWLVKVELPWWLLLSLVAVTAVTNIVYAVWLKTLSTSQSDAKISVESASDGGGGPNAHQNVALGLMILDLVTLTAMLHVSGVPIIHSPIFSL